jgi:hypothetical protein
MGSYRGIKMKNDVFRAILIMATVFVGIGSFPGYAAEQVGVETGNVAAKDKDVLARAEPIKAKDGSVIGFRVEVFNLSAETSLVLALDNENPSQICVQLFNERGQDITFYLLQTSENYRSEILFPLTSHSWLIPVPSHIRVEDKVVPISPGKYGAQVLIASSLFYQEKKAQSPAVPQQYIPWSLALPKLVVDVNPSSLSQENLVDAYVRNVTENSTKSGK